MNSLKKHISIILLSVLFFFINGCKKKSSEKIDMHFNYFGLIEGRYVIYDVKEMSHDVALNPQHDTISYQLKTVIGDETTDNQGLKAREFKRYKRATINDKWVISDIWTSVIDNYKAQLVEENQRVIKLIFAPTINKKWNPNSFNSLDSLQFYYTNIHIPYTLGNLAFDSTLMVQDDDFFSLIDYKVNKEKYATNVGLISKTFKNLTIANFDTLNVKKGNEIHYKCIEYGFE
jgi:hypothetical protein